jgi:hypothetical protein
LNVPEAANPASPVHPSRVITWITPPSALDPYRAENGPRTISTRSIASTGTDEKNQ